jgi:hypothetical protein
MRRTIMLAVVVGCVLAAGCGGGESRDASAPPADTAATSGSASASDAAGSGRVSQGGLRDYRYCEILVIHGVGDSIVGDVYNTVGLNECPQSQWESIDADSLRKALHASAIVMNGPRYFAMDSNSVGTPGPTVTFDSLQMHVVAQILLPPGSLLGSNRQEPYREHTIARSTRYVYLAGDSVYALVSPGGTYVMQAYSQIVDPTFSHDDLGTLGSRLKLPPGWTYRAMTIPSNLVLVPPNDTATITQDELQNSYQRIEGSLP